MRYAFRRSLYMIERVLAPATVTSNFSSSSSQTSDSFMTYVHQNRGAVSSLTTTLAAPYPSAATSSPAPSSPSRYRCRTNNGNGNSNGSTHAFASSAASPHRTLPSSNDAFQGRFTGTRTRRGDSTDRRQMQSRQRAVYRVLVQRLLGESRGFATVAGPAVSASYAEKYIASPRAIHRGWQQSARDQHAFFASHYAISRPSFTVLRHAWQIMALFAFLHLHDDTTTTTTTTPPSSSPSSSFANSPKSTHPNGSKSALPPEPSASDSRTVETAGGCGGLPDDRRYTQTLPFLRRSFFDLEALLLAEEADAGGRDADRLDSRDVNATAPGAADRFDWFEAIDALDADTAAMPARYLFPMYMTPRSGQLIADPLSSDTTNIAPKNDGLYHCIQAVSSSPTPYASDRQHADPHQLAGHEMPIISTDEMVLEDSTAAWADQQSY